MASHPKGLVERYIFTRGVVADVIQQHAEDCFILSNTWRTLLHQPHIKLRHLQRFDNRLAAHLDGLSIAGEDSWPQCQAALETLSASAMFVATVRTIEMRREDRIGQLFMLAQADLDAQTGLKSAFGWITASELRGLVSGLLNSKEPLRRAIGIVASAMHRVRVRERFGSEFST